MNTPNDNCVNCGYHVTDGTKHRGDGEGMCEVYLSDTEQVIGWKRRKPPRDLYKKH